MSKRSEAVAELRGLTPHEIDEQILVRRRRLFEVRFQQATGQVENHRLRRDLRRGIARALTVKAEELQAVEHRSDEEATDE